MGALPSLIHRFVTNPTDSRSMTAHVHNKHACFAVYPPNRVHTVQLKENKHDCGSDLFAVSVFI